MFVLTANLAMDEIAEFSKLLQRVEEGEMNQREKLVNEFTTHLLHGKIKVSTTVT